MKNIYTFQTYSTTGKRYKSRYEGRYTQALARCINGSGKRRVVDNSGVVVSAKV